MMVITKKVRLFCFLLIAIMSYWIFAAKRDKVNNTVIYLHKQKSFTSTKSLSLDELVKHGKTIVIFYEEWCSWCNKMTPIFDDLASHMTDISFIKIKRETFRSLFNAYNLTTVPAMLFFKDGNLLKIQPESLSKEKLVQLICEVY